MLVAGGGYLEISINHGNAQESLGVHRGSQVNLILLKEEDQKPILND